jgi:hypothetical protein
MNGTRSLPSGARYPPVCLTISGVPASTTRGKLFLLVSHVMETGERQQPRERVCADEAYSPPIVGVLKRSAMIDFINHPLCETFACDEHLSVLRCRFSELT